MKNYMDSRIKDLGFDDVLTATSKSGRAIKVICCSGKFGFDIDLKSKQILYSYQRGALNGQELKEVTALLNITGEVIK